MLLVVETPRSGPDMSPDPGRLEHDTRPASNAEAAIPAVLPSLVQTLTGSSRRSWSLSAPAAPVVAAAGIWLAPGGRWRPRRSAAAAAAAQARTRTANSPVSWPAPSAAAPPMGPRRKPVVKARAPSPLYRPAAPAGARSLMIAGSVGESR